MTTAVDRIVPRAVLPIFQTADLQKSMKQSDIAVLQNIAVAERMEAEPTTQHKNGAGLAVRQARIALLAESCRQ